MAVSEKMVEAAMVATHGKNWRKASRGWAIGAEATIRRALEAAEAVRGGDAAPPAGTVAERIADIGGVSARELIFALRVCGIEEEKAAALIRDAMDRGGLVLGERLRLYPAVPEVGAVVEGVDRG